MIPISIETNLKSKCPSFRLGCIECEVSIQSENVELWQVIHQKVVHQQATLSMSQIKDLPNIAAARKTYKTLGKDPSRYRLSSEALLRRIVNGKGLYKINNVVDALNLVSLSTGFSIGGFDADKIVGSIQIGIGQKGEPYEAIGRGRLNIENLPILRDNLGAFGSPTSDSMRTRVQATAQRFFMVILDFGSSEDLNHTMQLAIQLLSDYAEAKAIKSWVV